MLIYTHPACFKHDPGPVPGYAPLRLKAVIEALKGEKFRSLGWREPPALAPDELCLIHTPGFVADVLSPIAAGKERFFDKDTRAMCGTAEAALHASGAVLAATADVLSGITDKAFCIVSPGGHHAEAEAAIGFCFFNHIALAAIAAQKKMGVGKVAVVDFDAHHGNGTQGFFWNFDDRLFISLHEDTPLSGFAHETGAWNNILNIPLPKGSDGAFFRKAFEEKVIPKLTAFKPDVLFVSAGFDMHISDPLASLGLTEKDYGWIGTQLREAADSLCGGRLVAVLEGGYDLAALGASCAAFVEGMMGTLEKENKCR